MGLRVVNEQSPPVPSHFDELGWEPRRPTRRTPARLACGPALAVVGRPAVRGARGGRPWSGETKFRRTRSLQWRLREGIPQGSALARPRLRGDGAVGDRGDQLPACPAAGAGEDVGPGIGLRRRRSAGGRLGSAPRESLEPGFPWQARPSPRHDRLQDCTRDRPSAHVRDHLSPRRRQDHVDGEAASLLGVDPDRGPREKTARDGWPPPTGWGWSKRAVFRSLHPRCSFPTRGR